MDTASVDGSQLWYLSRVLYMVLYIRCIKIVMYNLYFVMYTAIHPPRTVPARLSRHTAHTVIQRIQLYSVYIIHRHTASLCFYR